MIDKIIEILKLLKFQMVPKSAAEIIIQNRYDQRYGAGSDQIRIHLDPLKRIRIQRYKKRKNQDFNQQFFYLAGIGKKCSPYYTGNYIFNL